MAIPIRIGLPGCGGIAEWHVKGYLQRPEDVCITAVSDVVAANAQKVSQEIGGAELAS